RAARQELPELPLDEAGKPTAVAPVARLAQERLEVLSHYPMEDGALGRSGLIDSGAHGRRASEARAVHVSARRTALPASRPRRPATLKRGVATRTDAPPLAILHSPPSGASRRGATAPRPRCGRAPASGPP